MGMIVEPDTLRSVAGKLNDIGDRYEALAAELAGLSDRLDAAFDPGVMPVNLSTEAPAAYHALYSVVYETAAAIRTAGEFLQFAADNHDNTEAENVRQFGVVMDDAPLDRPTVQGTPSHNGESQEFGPPPAPAEVTDYHAELNLD